MKLLITITREDGQDLKIDNTVWKLLSADGLDKPSVSIFSDSRAGGDGDIVTGQRIGARSIELKFSCRDATLNDILRRSVTSFFRPSQSFVVRVDRSGVIRLANGCRLDSIDIPCENVYVPIQATVSLLCPDGVFESEEAVTAIMRGTEPKFGYPYVNVAGTGRVYGIRYNATIANVTNDGDTDAFCQIVLYARAAVTNPWINVNGTAEAFTFQSTLAEGDTVVIDARTGTVTKNGVNGWGAVYPYGNMDDLKLLIGDNTVQFGASSGASNLDVYVYHNDRFMGA